jgi:hypothetical protein
MVWSLPCEPSTGAHAAAATRQASGTQQRRRRGRVHTLNNTDLHSVTHPGLAAGRRRVLPLQGIQHRLRQVHRQDVPHPARLCVMDHVQRLQPRRPG